MAPEKRDGWEVRESSYVIDTPHLRLRKDSIDLPDGRRIEDYYVRESLGFTVIFALTPEGRVILVRQYKHGAAQCVLELPAGMIEAGETPQECARRELAEETGYVGDPPAPELIATFFADPTNSNMQLFLCLVRNARKSLAQRFDPTEDIAVELATPDELRALVRDGAIVVNSHVASIYFMLDRLGFIA